MYVNVLYLLRLLMTDKLLFEYLFGEHFYLSASLCSYCCPWKYAFELMDSNGNYVNKKECCSSGQTSGMDKSDSIRSA